MSKKLKYYLLYLLFVAVAAPRAATAKTLINSVNNSVDIFENQNTQLERIINAHSQLLIQFQQLIANNQRDIDFLRGYIQENQYQLSQIMKQQKKIYQMIDNLSDQIISNSTNGISKNVAPIANKVTVVNNSKDNTDYNQAVSLVLEKKNYDQAISAFSTFIKLYPNSAYQPNANYWLGQLNYNNGKKDKALYYFALVAKNYPKSSKAPESLLKVGLILQEKNQKDKAKIIYKQIMDLYPSNEIANQAKKQLSKLLL